MSMIEYITCQNQQRFREMESTKERLEEPWDFWERSVLYQHIMQSLSICVTYILRQKINDPVSKKGE